ncbi:hypothetical protein AVEN_96601-1 [Araneus ventricosus]|uniref:Uncharacterized protein n=1 Tax=Araneus ventricosus TaxID=182803 RepID=A0A4Y2L139_ARAVE|nr:hypothetical protein AVEN_96601-1 [Araneus ventricosus]
MVAATIIAGDQTRPQGQKAVDCNAPYMKGAGQFKGVLELVFWILLSQKSLDFFFIGEELRLDSAQQRSSWTRVSESCCLQETGTLHPEERRVDSTHSRGSWTRVSGSC